MSLVYVVRSTKSPNSGVRVRPANSIKREAFKKDKDSLYEFLNPPSDVTSRLPDGYKGPLYKFYGDYEKYAESLCESPEEIYARWMGSSRKVGPAIAVVDEFEWSAAIESLSDHRDRVQADRR